MTAVVSLADDRTVLCCERVFWLETHPASQTLYCSSQGELAV